MLEFNLTNEKLILFSAKAPQVKHMIDFFLTELKKVRDASPVGGMGVREGWMSVDRPHRLSMCPPCLSGLRVRGGGEELHQRGQDSAQLP